MVSRKKKGRGEREECFSKPIVVVRLLPNRVIRPANTSVLPSGIDLQDQYLSAAMVDCDGLSVWTLPSRETLHLLATSADQMAPIFVVKKRGTNELTSYDEATF